MTKSLPMMKVPSVAAVAAAVLLGAAPALASVLPPCADLDATLEIDFESPDGEACTLCVLSAPEECSVDCAGGACGASPPGCGEIVCPEPFVPPPLAEGCPDVAPEINAPCDFEAAGDCYYPEEYGDSCSFECMWGEALLKCFSGGQGQGGGGGTTTTTPPPDPQAGGDEDGIVCTTEWKPVCADGKVYSNACEAGAAGQEVQYEIESPDSVTAGKDCPPESVDPQGGGDEDGIVCTTEWKPVCADGKVYSNACEAGAAGQEVQYEIESPDDSITAGKDCPPESVDPQGGDDEDGIVCTEEWKPVCADGKVYSNACEAGAAGQEVQYEIESPDDSVTAGKDCPPESPDNAEVDEAAPSEDGADETKTIPIDGWELPYNGPKQVAASVGDTITFSWSRGGHNVYIHPTMDCTLDARIRVGNDAAGTSYTFVESDAGSDLFFSCDIGEGAHCNAGQSLIVSVAGGNGDEEAEPDEDEPAEDEPAKTETDKAEPDETEPGAKPDDTGPDETDAPVDNSAGDGCPLTATTALLAATSALVVALLA